MVFGAPRVEKALAMVIDAGLLVLRAVATETSVVMQFQLYCVLITLH